MSSSDLLHRLRYALAIVQPSQVRLGRFRCPICGPSALLRLSPDAIGVRCLRCKASAVTLSFVSALISICPDFKTHRVYEMSSRGPLFEFLRREVPQFTFSEYFDDVVPGLSRNGVQCQDVQRLSFENGSFGLCTSTEVFEHVPDDSLGFSEVRRVLVAGGLFLFTVPLSRNPRTVERAAMKDGRVVHMLPPAYHSDRLRGRDAVLVYRDYGTDITDRLVRHGFAKAWIDSRFKTAFLGHGVDVVAALA
jgi:SAM-dependent methyltransferase